MDKDIASLAQKANDLSTNIDELKNTELKATRSLQDESKKMESLLNKRSVWLQKREEAQRKIREIGSVPAESSAKFKGQAPTKWLKALQDTNAKLKGYSHVNKKALDQFVNFTEQKEVLNSRKQDLDAGEKAIAELVTTLDRQKDEAIERTFKGVAKYFSQTFSELTGGGTATLIRQRKCVKGSPIDIP
jgi:structural maintenance of chromosome 3 (chondroitin sulfate proteoglycan 6)